MSHDHHLPSMYPCLISTGDEPEDAELEAPKIYEPITSFESLSERLISFVEMYNESIRGARMDLVFFKVKPTNQSLSQERRPIGSLCQQN
jgi:hypothetical protein